MTKKNLFFLIFSAIFLASLFSCSTTNPLNEKEKIVSPDEIEKKGPIYYEKSTNTPFTGIIRTYHPNGIISSEGRLKNGKKDGKLKKYDKNGGIIRESYFKDGILVKENNSL